MHCLGEQKGQKEAKGGWQLWISNGFHFILQPFSSLNLEKERWLLHCPTKSVQAKTSIIYRQKRE